MADTAPRPTIDTLERRALFSVTPAVPTCSLDDNNTLVIRGTSGTDRIDVRANEHGMLVRLNADGSQRKRIAPGVVDGIKIDGGGGSDSVVVNSVTHFMTTTTRVEHRTVLFADGQASTNFATAVQPGRDDDGAEHWLRRYQRQQKALAGQNARALLIGDSITERLRVQGRDEYAKLDERFDVADLGFSGDTTSSLLYRLQHDLIKGLWPRTIFVSIGTNNIALTDDVKSTVHGIRRVLGEIKAQRPKSQIVLSSILPRGERDGERKTVDAVNAKLDDLAAEFDAVWSDAALAFPEVKLARRDFEASSVHLTRFGYAKWAPVIASALHAASVVDD